MIEHNRIVSVSGVHGVGKSTLVSELCKLHGAPLPPLRLPSPFEDLFLAFMFYILAFAKRDTSVFQRTGLSFVDRHSARDMLVDIWTLYELKRLTDSQVDTLKETCHRILVPFGPPACSILLDDDIENVVSRIKSRPLPFGHPPDLEYDREYIEAIIMNFRREFESEEITVGRFGMKVASPLSRFVAVEGASPFTLAVRVTKMIEVDATLWTERRVGIL